jgi:hypothetical protein
MVKAAVNGFQTCRHQLMLVLRPPDVKFLGILVSRKRMDASEREHTNANVILHSICRLATIFSMSTLDSCTMQVLGE